MSHQPKYGNVLILTSKSLVYQKREIIHSLLTRSINTVPYLLRISFFLSFQKMKQLKHNVSHHNPQHSGIPSEVTTFLFVFHPSCGLKKNVTTYIYMHPKTIFQCFMYFKTYIYKWRHIVLILLQSAFFHSTFCFLRIIHVDAKRKLNIISDSENIQLT